MAPKQLKGVGGVLGNLLSQPEPSPSPVREDAPTVAPPAEVPPSPVRSSTTSNPVSLPKPTSGEKQSARRGRPPAGSKTTGPVEREKVSLRLRADLAAVYREWSWEERCQFSDLVDRAMESYLKNHRKARMPERE